MMRRVDPEEHCIIGLNACTDPGPSSPRSHSTAVAYYTLSPPNNPSPSCTNYTRFVSGAVRTHTHTLTHTQIYTSHSYGVFTGGAQREGDKPTNKSDRTYKRLLPPPPHRMRRNENFKSARGCRNSQACVRKHRICICSERGTRVCVCMCCSSVATALWFLKTFVRHPCPVLCPRARMCV